MSSCATHRAPLRAKGELRYPGSQLLPLDSNPPGPTRLPELGEYPRAQWWQVLPHLPLHRAAPGHPCTGTAGILPPGSEPPLASLP